MRGAIIIDHQRDSDMRIIVMGAGLLGVSSAYYLAEEGHEVVVVDRRAGPAEETSFANAGLLTPGHAYSWASPRAPLTLLQSLWKKDAALRFRFSADPRFWIWGLRFLRQCTAARSRANTLEKLKLCLYSLAETQRLSEATGILWDYNDRGALYLYEDAEHFREGCRNMQLLADRGVAMRVLDRDALIATEPALARSPAPILGAIHTPDDASGDARKFTLALADIAKRRGVVFRFGETIKHLRRSGNRLTAIVTDREEIVGDLYLLALGSYAPILARTAGLGLPIYPVKGYSITLPVADSEAAPSRGGVHEDRLVAFSRLGDRLRFTATADFAGYDTGFRAADFAPMLKTAKSLFPAGGDFDRIDYWSCLRPMTPGGPPIMGPSPIANLHLAAGHGHMGWTMAAGSARLIADAIAGRKPEIDLAPFRYGA